MSDLQKEALSDELKVLSLEALQTSLDIPLIEAIASLTSKIASLSANGPAEHRSECNGIRAS